jgi:hypothetical protein
VATTLPADTTEPSPIVTPGSMIALGWIKGCAKLRIPWRCT